MLMVLTLPTRLLWYSHCPHVYFAVVSLVSEQLGSGISRGPTLGSFSSLTLQRFEAVAQSEVYDLEVPCFGKHDVLHLEVPVYDARAVNVPHSTKELPHEPKERGVSSTEL